MLPPHSMIIDFCFKVGVYILISQSFIADLQFIVRISIGRVDLLPICTLFNSLILETFFGCFLIGRIVVISNSQLHTKTVGQDRQILHQTQIRLQHALIQFIITDIRKIGYRIRL